MPTSKQRCDAPADIRDAAGRLGHPAQNFQQSALAGAIAADNADDLAGLNRKRDVLERPEFGPVREGLPSPRLFRKRAKNCSTSSRMVRALNCPSL